MILALSKPSQPGLIPDSAAPKGLLGTGSGLLEGSLGTCFRYLSPPPGSRHNGLRDSRGYFFPTRRAFRSHHVPGGRGSFQPPCSAVSKVQRSSSRRPQPHFRPENRKAPLSLSHLKGAARKTFKGPDDNEYANVVSTGPLLYLQKCCLMFLMGSKLPLKSTGDLG